MQGIIIIIIVVIAAAGAAAYYFMATPPPCPSGSKCIAIVTDVNGRGDLAFNDMAFLGGDMAAKDFGLKLVELISRKDSDYVPNLELAAKDPNIILVVAVGFLLADAINATAHKYPDKNFMIIDYPNLNFGPNVMGIVYEEHKGSAIVGAIAALAAAYYQYARIGAVLGMKIPLLYKFEIGYKWGADWALKWYQAKFNKMAPVIGDTPINERVLSTYTGSFSDIVKGYEAAKPMYEKGALAVYNVAGQCGLGVAQAVKELAKAKGLTMGPPFWIGVDANQDWYVPGFTLASAMKRVDKGVYLAAQLAVQGQFRQVVQETQGTVVLGIGTKVSGTLFEGIAVSTLADLDEFIQMGVKAKELTGKDVLPMSPEEIKSTVAAMRNALPSWIWDAAKELEDGIRSGQIQVPMVMTDQDLATWRAIVGTG
jgi:basic membrane protein A